MTIQAILKLIARWWWLLLGGIALGIGAGYGIQVMQGVLEPGSLATYSAKATVTVGTEVQGLSQSNSDLSLAESLVPTYVELAQLPPITDSVVDNLNLAFSTGKLVETHLEVSQPDRTQLIEITGKGPDPVIAAAIANETALQLQATAPVRPTRLIQIVSLAETPEKPTTEPYLLMGIAAVAGLLIAIGPVLLIEFALDRPYTPEWAEARMELPCLATYNGRNAPGRRSLFSGRKAATASLTEPAWHVIMATLNRATAGTDNEGQGKAIVITSSKPDNSKPAAAISLAYAAAASGKKTILVDADVRRKSANKKTHIQDWLRLDGSKGITKLAQNGYDGQDAQKMFVKSEFDGLTIMPAGPTPTTEGQLLQDEFWKNLINDLRGQADMIVINAPAIRAAPESIPLAAYADAVLVTMELGKTRASQVNEVEDVLTKSGAKLLGALLDNG